MARKRLPVVLDKSEAEALLGVPNTGCPSGLRNRAILDAMYRAGLRVSEVVNLRSVDIRWESGILEVRRGKGGVDRNVPSIRRPSVGSERGTRSDRGASGSSARCAAVRFPRDTFKRW